MKKKILGLGTTLPNGNTVWLGSDGKSWQMKFGIVQGKALVETTVRISNEAMDTLLFIKEELKPVCHKED